MSCVHPIPALDLGFKINDSGEKVRNIKLLYMNFKNFAYGLEELKEKYGDSLILLPCGRCYSCAVDYAREWSARIMIEADHHLQNCFLTLTYDDFHKPPFLSKRDIQLFIKRLRKEVQVPIRYFLCGELGEGKGEREEGENPHYHCIIFGYDFQDKELLKRSKSGMMIYRSPLLDKLWPFGMSSIGSVTPESAQYCAKYSLKRKLSGVDHGEFVLMSRRPGIGRCGYSPEIWETDKLYLHGRNYKVPRYFNKIAEKEGSFPYFVTKFERMERGKTYKSKKYEMNLDREEDALKRLNDIKIFNDCLKVRI